MDNDLEQSLREQVIQAAVQYYTYKYDRKEPFKPGDRIPYAGRVFDQKEITNLMGASLDFWLTEGRYTLQFERSLAGFLGVRHCSLTNSGSSANLLAFMALTSPKLGDRRIAKNDEVITVAACFPTTVSPIVLYGAIPVFVDIELGTCNIDCGQLEAALSTKTKAVMLAHTLGNPFNLDKVSAFCQRHGLWLIEDNCDALGTKYFYQGRWRYTGTFGHLGTSSFYPAHHITTGEGGAVYSDDAALCRLVESFRDWGRDCCCPAGHDNTCGQRFTQRFGDLPLGYDHKYVYSHFGFNLKATDLQAAVGCAQIEKLDSFIQARRNNWELLREGLEGLSDRFVLPVPAEHSEPSWFGFLLTLREKAGLTREQIVNHLEACNIQTRMLFAGNLIQHPCFDEMKMSGLGFRLVDELTNTNRILRDSFWIGVYPGLTEPMIEFIVDRIKEVCNQ